MGPSERAVTPAECIECVSRLLSAEDCAGNEAAIAQVIGAFLGPYARPPLYQRFFNFFQAKGVHVTPVHFYQALPDTRALSEELWETPSEMPGVDLNEAAQLELLETSFARFRDECTLIPSKQTADPNEYYFENGLFGGTDALVLYCMIRHFRPRLILEVGSGASSLMSAKAALKNGSTELVCIEPFPNDSLKAGFPGLTHLIEDKVQNVSKDVFARLNANDILFIDSSHVSKIGSDVNFLFLEIIPRLNPGVIVHVHDIFFPCEYRRDWVLNEFRFWNEQYMLQAFLMFNAEFEVLMSNSVLGFKYRDRLVAAFPNSPWWGGGSFWMRRRNPAFHQHTQTT